MVSLLTVHVHHCCPKQHLQQAAGAFPWQQQAPHLVFSGCVQGDTGKSNVGKWSCMEPSPPARKGYQTSWDQVLWLVPCLALCSTSLLPQHGQGFTSSRAVSCALSVGSASGPAAAQTAVNHCVWLQYKVPLEVFWWVFSCLFFA